MGMKKLTNMPIQKKKSNKDNDADTGVNPGESMFTINEALAKIRKQYGAGAVMTEGTIPEHVETVPSGSFALDYVMGTGLPRGRIIEIYGPESSGKSTMCSFVIANLQKRGKTCVYIDAEQAFDAKYAEKIGVDTKKLLLAQPDTLEEAMDIVKAFVLTNSVDLIIVDSVPALVPREELEREEMIKDTVGLLPRKLGIAMRILTPIVAKTKATVIFINQVREKVGGYSPHGGPVETTPGGRSMKHTVSIRLKVSRGELFKKGEEQIGNQIKIKAIKNKVAPPNRECIVDLYYGSGIDRASDIFEEAVRLGIIEKSGNTYSLQDGEKLGVGREQAKDALKEMDSKKIKDIENKITEKLYAKEV